MFFFYVFVSFYLIEFFNISYHRSHELSCVSPLETEMGFKNVFFYFLIIYIFLIRYFLFFKHWLEKRGIKTDNGMVQI